jgi:hypothetical protein
MDTRILLILGFILSSCSFISPERRYLSTMEHNTDGFFVPGQDFRVVGGDSGQAFRSEEDVFSRTPSSAPEKQSYEDEQMIVRELRVLESKMDPETARVYYQYQQNFPTPSEKVYFLRLPSREERHHYLSSRGLIARRAAMDPLKVDSAIRSRDVVLGMSKNDVMASWGRPDRVDLAGSPRMENERWTFFHMGKIKQVFFEGGVVQGWYVE